MAQRARAAVHVDLVVRQAEVVHRGHRDDRERLVDLEEVGGLRVPAGLLEELADRADRRRREPLRLLRVRGVADDARERARCRAARASERLISTSAAAPSEIELELAAVTVPSFRNAGFSCGMRSRLALSGCSSVRTTVSALPPAIVTGTISLLEGAAPDRLLRAGEGGDRVAVLRLAREAVLARAILGESAHQAPAVVGVLQAVEEHVVLHLAVAEPQAARAPSGSR